MKIIILGGKGLVGKNISPHFSTCHEIITVDIEEWDITNIEKSEEFIRQYTPDAIINLAAVTNVDGCEDNVELARKVNGEAPGFIAEICEKYHAKLIHLSTDYIFNGKKNTPYIEEDAPDPQSVYGITKLTGERNIMRKNPSSLIIRAEWVYGDGGENFITKIKKIADEKGMVEVVNDQRGAPTYAKDLALPLKTLIENGNSGIYHIANSGSCTWFEFAKEIFSQLQTEIEVKPITSTQLNRKAKRPSYSVYDCSKLQKDTGIVMRSWQTALKEYLG
ncbi:MAG: dTDP-4-dehydrorhamnose reductase [Proteobacteria bacterium]|nr:dTDP-4-dehydrorhamnose reductase [Pseudomonadota bacterium]